MTVVVMLFLFPRATSQVAMLAWIFGDCREGQIPRSPAAEYLTSANKWAVFFRTLLISFSGEVLLFSSFARYESVVSVYV